MRHVICLLSFLLVSCASGMPDVTKLLERAEPEKPPPPNLPAPKPHPTLRVFECDRDHCHQIYRVSADTMGGKFYLEGKHERKTLMTFEDEDAMVFYDPVGPPVTKQAEGGPVTVTPFVYVHHLGKPGIFKVVLRRTVCDGKVCDYVVLQQPVPLEFAAELYISSDRPKKPQKNVYPIAH